VQPNIESGSISLVTDNEAEWGDEFAELARVLVFKLIFNSYLWRLPDGFAARVREVLAATLADEERSVRLVHDHLTKRLTELDAREENLLDLVEGGGAVAAKVRARLLAIVEERARVNGELAAQGPLLEAGAAVIEAALDLLDNLQELYRQTTDPVRRQLNQVFFDKLYLDADEVIDDRSGSKPPRRSSSWDALPPHLDPLLACPPSAEGVRLTYATPARLFVLNKHVKV
jgi:hypothetical protein